MDVLKPLVSKDSVYIYQLDIDNAVNEYISLLDNSELIYKPSCFHGLLEHIYKKYLKDIIKLDNGLYNDYRVLNDIFYNIYVPLCYKYNMSPTLISFCVNMVHIDYSYIRDIKDGKKRNEYNIKQDVTKIVNQWSNVSESTLLQKTIDSNSIGSIFGLKSLYHYSDNQPQVVSITTSQSHQTVDEIRQKYASAFLPSKEELSDNLDSIEFSDND